MWPRQQAAHSSETTMPCNSRRVCSSSTYSSCSLANLALIACWLPGGACVAAAAAAAAAAGGGWVPLLPSLQVLLTTCHSCWEGQARPHGARTPSKRSRCDGGPITTCCSWRSGCCLGCCLDQGLLKKELQLRILEIQWLRCLSQLSRARPAAADRSSSRRNRWRPGSRVVACS